MDPVEQDTGREAGLTLVDLPSDPMLHVLSYVGYRDLARCSQVCRSLHDLVISELANQLWRAQCRVQWAVSECPANRTWHEEFVAWYADLGNYVDCYRAVRQAWTQIETYMERYVPRLRSAIMDGASEAQLNDLEAVIGAKLPLALRCVYRLHDGQHPECSLGLMGGLVNYDHRRSDGLIPLIIIKTEWMKNRQRGVIPPQFLPLTFCPDSGAVLYLMLGEGPLSGLNPGQLFFAQPHKGVGINVFIAGESYLDWFCRYAQELEQDIFPREEGRILKFYQDPLSTATTEHVRITVATTFVPEMSRVGTAVGKKLVHAYRVTLSMAKDAPPTAACQLESRHWRIVDEDGQHEPVDGPGVIGEYPVVRPGSEWSYVSCTHFQTDTGSMHGTYTMRNIATGAKFEADVPLFHMRTYPYIMLPNPS